MATIEHTGLLKYVDGNNNINVLYPEIGKKITLADYLALPEEEQKTGVYWIEDANEPLGDGSRFLKTTDVVDSFDSSDSTLPLSAKKGKELYENKFSKSDIQNGTVVCKYVNSTTLYGQIYHDLGDQYNCIATPIYVGDNPLEDFTNLSVVIVRHNNLVEFFVKGNGFTNDSGIYVNFLLIGL